MAKVYILSCSLGYIASPLSSLINALKGARLVRIRRLLLTDDSVLMYTSVYTSADSDSYRLDCSHVMLFAAVSILRTGLSPM